MNLRYFWAMVFILAGLLFLLDNLGLLPGSAWGYIVPLILIFLGAYLIAGSYGGRPFEAVTDFFPLEGASAARIVFKHGAGSLSVFRGAEPEMLFSGTFGGGVDKDFRRIGDKLEMGLQPSQREWAWWLAPWNWADARGLLDWNVGLNSEIPLELIFETGASKSRIDLSNLKVSELTIKTGASATELVLPEQAGHTRARISSGAASVDIYVPVGVAARIRGTMGLGSLNIDQRRFPRRNGSYESDGFGAAENTVELDIQGGVGSVSLR